MMHLIPLNINRAKRSGGAEVFASATAYAFVFIYGRHFHRAIRTFVVNHLDGSRGAMALAVAAADAVGQHYTVFLDPHGMTDMLRRFFFSRDGLDGSRRTDLAASCTLGATVAALKRHHRLHEVLEVSRGAQNIVWARGNAKLTCRAMLLHVACRNRTRRRDGCLAFRGFLVLDDRQTAVYLHLGLGHSR